MNKSVIYSIIVLILVSVFGIIYYLNYKQSRRYYGYSDYNDYDKFFGISSAESSGEETTLFPFEYEDLKNFSGEIKKLDLSECTRKVPIKTSKGSKTICYMGDNALPYTEAEKYCQINGGELYKFDSVEKYDEWQKLANSIWTPPIGAAVWVNGRRDDECFGTFKIVNGLEELEIQGDVIFEDLDNCGECMRMLQTRGIFIADPKNCDTTMTFFCEF